ncbi:MAG: transposase [Ardenticatenaceae bacterium]|nr:transposase [Ardenticatenaceae bacterium]
MQKYRWVIERTIAWLNRYRRLSKDYERHGWNSEATIDIASIHLMLRQLHPMRIFRFRTKIGGFPNRWAWL